MILMSNVSHSLCVISIDTSNKIERHLNFQFGIFLKWIVDVEIQKKSLIMVHLCCSSFVTRSNQTTLFGNRSKAPFKTNTLLLTHLNFVAPYLLRNRVDLQKLWRKMMDRRDISRRSIDWFHNSLLSHL